MEAVIPIVAAIVGGIVTWLLKGRETKLDERSAADRAEEALRDDLITVLEGERTARIRAEERLRDCLERERAGPRRN